MNNNELRHHGIKGMKWGVRRYQNKDGSYISGTRKDNRTKHRQTIKKLRSDYKTAKAGAKNDYKIAKQQGDNNARKNYKAAKKNLRYNYNQASMASSLTIDEAYVNNRKLKKSIKTMDKAERKLRKMSESKKIANATGRKADRYAKKVEKTAMNGFEAAVKGQQYLTKRDYYNKKTNQITSGELKAGRDYVVNVQSAYINGYYYESRQLHFTSEKGRS